MRKEMAAGFLVLVLTGTLGSAAAQQQSTSENKDKTVSE